MKWYTKTKPEDTQGLICDEKTGRNVAVSYDPQDAQLIASAPALRDALTDLLAAIKQARTIKAPARHYDEDVYYNGIDFAPQMDIAEEILRMAG